MIVNNTSLTGLFTSYDARFSAQYAAFQTDSAAKLAEFCMEMKSSTKFTSYAWLGKLPQMRRWFGARVLQNLGTRGYTLENKPFELTVEVERNDIEDDQFGVYGPWIDSVAQEAALLPLREVIACLQAGTTTLATEASPYGACFDGLSFFNDSHLTDPDNAGSATWDNDYTSTALTPANYDATRAAMIIRKGDKGQFLGVNPNVLLVPPQLEATAKMIVGNPDIGVASVGGLTQVGSATNPYAGTAKVVVLPELGGAATTWYLLDCSKPIKPLIWQDRSPLEAVWRNNPNDDNVFFLDKYVYGVKRRGTAGFGLPHLASRCIA